MNRNTGARQDCLESHSLVLRSVAEIVWILAWIRAKETSVAGDSLVFKLICCLFCMFQQKLESAVGISPSICMSEHV